MARRRRRRVRYRSNDPTPRRRRRRARYRYNAPSPRRRHRRRRIRHAFALNPRRRSRRYRRNPQGRAMAFRLDQPQQWIPPAVTVGLAVSTAAVAPRMVAGPGVTKPMAYLVQAGVGLGGALVMPMLGFRPIHAFLWPVAVFGVIAFDWIRTYALPWMGLSAYPYETAAELADMGQEPYYPPSLSQNEEIAAYPYQLGQAEEDLAAGPYGKTGYSSAVPGAPWES